MIHKHIKSLPHHPKRVIVISLIIALVVGVFGYLQINKKVAPPVVKTTSDVNGTGTSSPQNLSLGFLVGGRIQTVLVKAGDKVSKGQILATLDSGNTKGALAQAQAAYEKIINGATGPTVDVAKAAVNTAKVNLAEITKQQTTLVQNAKNTLLNSTPTAETVGNYNGYDAPTVTGTYICDQEGTYDVKTYSSSGGISVTYSGLEQGSFLLTDIPRPMGTCGLFLSFDKNKNLQAGIDFNVNIPNKNAPNYNANNNAYQLAVQNRDKAIADAQASVATDGNSSSSIVDAQIAQAQAMVDSINVKINNAKLYAPSNGTITQVDVKVGELAQAGVEAMKLLNIGDLHTEALVSEADIASVAVGQSIDNTFDALGPDKHFTTTVLTVNPASTIISGVVNYKVTGSLTQIPDVKPGMTANMTIEVASKKGVLVVPASAIINKNGKQVVRVITDLKKKTYIEVEVQTGLEADGGLTEITSGLKAGQEIVTYIK